MSKVIVATCRESSGGENGRCGKDRELHSGCLIIDNCDGVFGDRVVKRAKYGSRKKGSVWQLFSSRDAEDTVHEDH
jgi:hypothetical protein